LASSGKFARPQWLSSEMGSNKFRTLGFPLAASKR